MISLSIDVTKLDKSRFKHTTRKDGTKAIFCDLILFPGKDGTDQYGNDGMVKQQVTKEEREAKVQMPILGNFRHLTRPTPAPAPAPAPAIDAHNAAKANGYAPETEDNLPF